MNTIDAAMHKSRQATRPHPVLLVDGVPLEMWIQGITDDLGQDISGTLVPAQGWLIDEHDLDNAWYLLAPKNDMSSTIVPILVCPDDMNMTCTVAVVEQQVDADTVSWVRVGKAVDVLNGVVASVKWRIPNQKAVFPKADFRAAVAELRRLADEEWS